MKKSVCTEHAQMWLAQKSPVHFTELSQINMVEAGKIRQGLYCIYVLREISGDIGSSFVFGLGF
jgi:hypothetical protein